MAFIPIDPSPCSTRTCLSGFATCAPIPYGNPTPIVPVTPEFKRCPGIYVDIDCLPKCKISFPSTEMMASLSKNSSISLHKRNGCIGVWSELSNGAVWAILFSLASRNPTIQGDSSAPEKSGLLCSANSNNWLMTALASPKMPISIFRL